MNKKWTVGCSKMDLWFFKIAAADVENLVLVLLGIILAGDIEALRGCVCRWMY